MSFPYELSLRAKRDVAASRDWYDRQRPGLGDRFVDDVYRTIERVCQHPTSFPAVLDPIRRRRCSSFPFYVYFEVIGDHVAIQAVYHTSRDPELWAKQDRE